MGDEHEPEVGPEDPPEPAEARRIRGLAVPLVAAAVVAGIGLPLTALAVAFAGDQAGDGPSSPGAAGGAGAAAEQAPGEARGRARLDGAVRFDGPVSPIACTPGAPRLATLDAQEGRYSILVNVPGGTEAGTYALTPTAPAFVAVTRLSGGTQAWTSFSRGAASGEVTLRSDGWMTARFSGLEPNGGGAEGNVEGTLEVGCG